MKVVSSLSGTDVGPCVVSIGNFDGLHLGHRAILNCVIRRAKELGMRSAAMTFAPHPIQFLTPGRAPKLLSTLDQKIRLIEETGIDLLFVAKFDEPFSRLSPDEFIRQYLIEGFGAHTVCVGGNFNFGYRGLGTVQTLRQWKDRLAVIEVPSVRVRGVIVSSTRIRDLVAAGRVSRACRMLGRWIEIEGPLVEGEGRGKRATVPTLNMNSENELLPKIGVYITRISLDGGRFLDSITNVGVRPTFGEGPLTVETFVLRDRLPERAEKARLQFVRRVRDEAKFESLEELRRQIGIDIRRTEKFFRLFNTVRHAGSHSG